MRLVTNQRGYVFPYLPRSTRGLEIKPKSRLFPGLTRHFYSSGTGSEVLFDVGKVINISLFN
jgi:hypothetical protein